LRPKPGEPVRKFRDAGALERWLDKHHETAGVLWIQMAKKASGIPSIDWLQAVETVLCFGWIDGQRAALDDTWFLQRFTPRRKKSNWSTINREAAERLIAAGRMRPAGLAQVEAAKADGRWEAGSKPA